MPSVESHSELISFIQGHSPDSPVDLPCLHSLVAEVDLHSPLGHADNDQGYSVLHYAVLTGNGSLVKELLLLGHPWNAVSCNGISVGDLAREKGFNDLYADLVEEGARAELLLTAMGMSCRKYVDQDEDEDVEAPPNAEYLSSPLTYSEGRLLDADKNAVMMGWEEPLMVIHAKVIAPTPGKKVLNVGFGLGIIDMALQKLSPSEHTIIEAHPDVYKKMIQDGWDKKPGVKIIFGRWQDVMDQLEVYDGIFFGNFLHMARFKMCSNRNQTHLENTTTT